FIEGINYYSHQLEEPFKSALSGASVSLEAIRASRYGGVYNDNPWYHDYLVGEVEQTLNIYSELLKAHFPETIANSNEDNPIPFEVEEIPNYIESLAEKEGK